MGGTLSPVSQAMATVPVPDRLDYRTREAPKYENTLFDYAKLDDQESRRKLREMFRSGTDPDEWDQSGVLALNYTAHHGIFESTKLLLDAKAHPNARSTHGWAALHDACNNSHWEIAKMLIEYDADVHLQNKNGATPLEICRSQDKDVATELEELFLTCNEAKLQGLCEELQVLHNQNKPPDE